MSDDLIVSGIRFDTSEGKDDLSTLVASAESAGSAVADSFDRASVRVKKSFNTTSAQIAQNLAQAEDLMASMKDIMSAGVMSVTEMFEQLTTQERLLLINAGTVMGHDFMDSVFNAIKSEKAALEQQVQEVEDVFEKMVMYKKGSVGPFTAGQTRMMLLDDPYKVSDNGMISQAALDKANGTNAAAQKGAEDAKAFVAAQEAVYQQSMAELRVMQLQGLITPKDAEKQGVEAAKAFNLAIKGQLETGVGEDSMLLLSNSIKKVSEGSNMAGMGLSRMRFGLISFIASATGGIPIFDRLFTSFLFMGIDGPVVLAVLAGLAAIVEGYRLLTKGSRDAQEQQDKLTKSLDDWYKKQQEGASGGISDEIDAENKKLDQQKKSIDGLNEALDQFRKLTGLSGVNSMALAGQLEAITKAAIPLSVQLKAQAAAFINPFGIGPLPDANSVLKHFYEEQVKEIEKGGDEVKDAIGEASKKEIDAYVERQGKLASSLAGVISSGHATPQMRETANQLRTQLSQDVKIDLKATSTTDPQKQAEAVERLTKSLGAFKTINDAITNDPYDKLNKSLLSLAHGIEPTNDAMQSFDERVKDLKKEVLNLPGAVEQVTDRASKLRAELLELEKTKALEQIAKDSASITSTKIDDMAESIQEAGEKAKVTRASIAALGDPALLAGFEAMRAEWNNNQLALLQVQKSSEDYSGAIAALKDNLEALLPSNDQYRAQIEAEIDHLKFVASQTDASSEAHKKLMDQIAQLNDVLEKNTQIRGENAKSIEEEVKKIGELHEQQTKGYDEAAAKKIEEDQQLTKNMLKEMQRDVAQFFTNIFTDGIKSFGDLFKEIKNMFLKMIADMLAEDFMKKISGALMSVMGNLSKDVVLDPQTGKVVMSKVGGSTGTFLQGIGATAGGFGAGMMIGGMAANATTGALGGAAAGAAVGTMIMPGVGTVLGGLAGLAGGLLGFGDKLKSETAQINDAKRQWQTALDDYVKGLSPNYSSAQKQLDDLNKQFTQFQTGIKVKGFGINYGSDFQFSQQELESMIAALNDMAKHAPNKDMANSVRDYVNQLEKLDAKYKEASKDLQALLAQQSKQFEDDLHIRSLRAQGFGEEADAAAFAAQQAKELADATKQFGARSQEVFDLMLVQAEEAKKHADEVAEQQKQQQAGFAIRGAAAGGASDKTLSDMQFALDQEKELADLRAQGASPELIKQVQDLQAAEAKKRADDYAETQRQAQADYQVRLLNAQGHTQEAAALQFAEQQRREFDAAVKAGMDDATKAALQLAQAAEKAAFDAAQANAAMDSAFGDLQQQFQVFGTNPQDQLSQIANLFGFAGLSKDQVLAQYVQYTGTPLTDDQRELNKHIEEWLSAFNAAQAGSAANSNMPTALGGETTAVANAASVLTEATGDRMADYLASMLTVEKSILTEAQRQTTLISGGVSFSVPSVAPSSAPTAIQTSSSLDAAALSKLIAGLESAKSGDEYTIEVKVDRAATMDDPTYIKKIADEVVDELNVLLGDKQRAQILRSGTTVKQV